MRGPVVVCRRQVKLVSEPQVSNEQPHDKDMTPRQAWGLNIFDTGCWILDSGKWISACAGMTNKSSCRRLLNKLSPRTGLGANRWTPVYSIQGQASNGANRVAVSATAKRKQKTQEGEHTGSPLQT
jgi:hypothetical protein